jgi:hypothetical protein
MSELTDKLQRMLAQAQGFAKDAPLEALTRAQLAAKEAAAALPAASGEEREVLESLHAMAVSRSEKYQAVLGGWSETVRERANLFATHERERLAQPIPPKV